MEECCRSLVFPLAVVLEFGSFASFSLSQWAKGFCKVRGLRVLDTVMLVICKTFSCSD